MRDRDMTKAQLIDELNGLRRRIAELEKSEEECKRLEEALRYSEERRALMWSVTPDFVALFDRGMNICQINKSMARMFGKQPEELIGTCGLDLLPAELAETRRHYFGEVFRTGQTVRWEDSNRGKYFDNLAFPIREEKGQITRVTVVARDITKRKQAEEALAESEEKYRNVVEMATDGICIVQDSLVKYANSRQAEIWGGAIEEIINTPLTDYVHPDEEVMLIDRYNRRMAGEQIPSVYNASIMRKDGSRAYVELNVGLLNYLGKPAVLVITRDITKREELEQKLRESEHKYRQLIESLHQGIWVIDENAVTTYVNQPMADILGYSQEEMPGMSLFDFMDEDGVEIATQLLKKRRSGIREQHEFEFVRKDGTFVYTLLNTAPLTDDKGIYIGAIAGVLDITSRKQMEEALRESEKLFRIASQLTSDVVYERDLQTGVAVFYGDIDSHLGYGPGEYPRTMEGARERVHPEDRAWIDSFKIDEMESGVPHSIEYRMRKKDGTYMIWSDTVTIIRDEETGKPQKFIGAANNITKRKKMEEALKESEENLRTYLEFAPIGIAITNLDGNVIYTNRRAEEISGYRRGELLGKNYMELGLLSESEEIKLRNAIPIYENASIDIPLELELTVKDGVSLWVELTATSIRQPGGEASIIYFLMDVTERKKNEEELRKVERLESVGTLAGGIAHDFNNLLTGIMGNIGLAKRRMEPGEKAYERLEEAETASLRARDLTQQLLTFSSGGAPVKQVVSLGKIVEDSARFALRGSNVRCEFAISDDILPVEADESQIGHVVSNLVLNASQAMPSGGTIDIGVDNTTIIKRGSSLPLSAGKYVEITVQDHGVGIPVEYLPRIFDPYFTTKQKGSGLGLATAYSIIRNHGGHISVDSTQGVGTTVYVYLPTSQKRVRVRKKPVVEIPAVRDGRILIMDDEAAIRELLQDVLTGSGYKVKLAEDGAEATEEYRKAREAGQPFDVVILDLTIPGGMGGKETIERLLEIEPEVKAIVTSGYSTDPIMSDFAKYGFRDVIVKPFKITELENKLRDIIAGQT